MEAYRLKNITILILVFLNLFLLGLLVRHLWQEKTAQWSLEQELRQLYASHEMELAEDIDLTTSPPDDLVLSRDLASEAAVAAFLLEEKTEAEDQGGGIYSYSGELGTVLFRSSGAFDYTPANRKGTDLQTLSADFCRTFGYISLEEEISGGEGIITLLQSVGDSVIYNGRVTILFSRGELLSVSGTYVNLQESVSAGKNTVTRATALVRFLDYSNQSGTISSAVLSLRPVYELQVTTLGLTAKWEIVTDTGRYYVDCGDGTIIRG